MNLTSCDVSIPATLSYVAMTWPALLFAINMVIIFLQFWLKQNKIDPDDITKNFKDLLEIFAKNNNMKPIVVEKPIVIDIPKKEENMDELKKFSLV